MCSTEELHSVIQPYAVTTVVGLALCTPLTARSHKSREEKKKHKKEERKKHRTKAASLLSLAPAR